MALVAMSVSVIAAVRPAPDYLYLVIDLSDGISATNYPVTFLDAAPEGGVWPDEYKTTKLVLRKLPAGEDPLGRYTLSQPFCCGVFEVTQKQYELVMGSNPSSYKGDMRAEDKVSYNTIRGSTLGKNWPATNAVDETSFLGRIRARTGLHSLDLPTEAQWEYACRAGTTSLYNNGGSAEDDLKTLGRYYTNRKDGHGENSSGSGATTVGSYAPNAWGLYDMHGNAAEWCLDWNSGAELSGMDPRGAASGSDRIVRGGSWYTRSASDCTSSFRGGGYPTTAQNGSGFRLFCAAVAPPVEDVPIPLADLSVRWETEDFVYDGTAHGPGVTIRNDDVELSAGSDYLLEYEDNVNAGMARAILTGLGSYVGVLTNEFVIAPRRVTLMSGTQEWRYDGATHSNTMITVSGAGFVSGEGVTCGGFTEVLEVTSGTVVNDFSYTLNDGTLSSNYEITVVRGFLAILLAKLSPEEVLRPLWGTEDEGVLCTRVYNGAPQPFTVEPETTEPYHVTYSLTEDDESSYSETAPTCTHVSEGDLTVYFKFVMGDAEPYYGFGTLRIVPKEIVDEMVQPGKDAFFWDGSDKKPTVDVRFFVDGSDVCTSEDYLLSYGSKVDEDWVVTVVGMGDYCGTVTKVVPVLKRSVTPPVIRAKSYNGKSQVASVPTDSRWTIVANPGGIDAGTYTNVILRLTHPDDYRWADADETDVEIALTFSITRANNGWNQAPGIMSWAYGETPSEPTGSARYGELQIAYRREGLEVSAETNKRPSLPGSYIARFWVDESPNYAGVAVTTYKEVAFEITGTMPAGAFTQTTPVAVPHIWLEPYLAQYGDGVDYEKAGHAVGANGVPLWKSYVADLIPDDPQSRFRTFITVGADGRPIVSWSPAVNGDGIKVGERIYRIYGKVKLEDEQWTPDVDEKSGIHHFFKVTIEMP